MACWGVRWAPPKCARKINAAHVSCCWPILVWGAKPDPRDLRGRGLSKRVLRSWGFHVARHRLLVPFWSWLPVIAFAFLLRPNDTVNQ